MPQRALKMTFDWLEIHKSELMEDWNLAQKGEIINKIEPLRQIIMFLEEKKAQYIKDFKLLLEFKNGVDITVDLENELNGTVFIPLKDLEYFKKFSIHYNTIEWDNGADFAPEYLFQVGKQQDQLKLKQTIL